MAFLARESGEVDFASQDAKDGEGLRTACKMGKFFRLSQSPSPSLALQATPLPQRGRGIKNDPPAGEE